MGIFSSSYKYYAYAGSDNLFEDDNRPNTVLSLMINGILGGHSDPPESILIGLNTNMYARAKSMLKYAARENGYIYGTPNTNQNNIRVPKEAVRDAIEAETGEPVRLLTMSTGPIREDFFIAKEVDANYLNPAHFPWSEGDPHEPNWEERTSHVEIPVINEDAVDLETPYYFASNPPLYAISGQNPNHYFVEFYYEVGNEVVPEANQAFKAAAATTYFKYVPVYRYTFEAAPEMDASFSDATIISWFERCNEIWGQADISWIMEGDIQDVEISSSEFSNPSSDGPTLREQLRAIGPSGVSGPAVIFIRKFTTTGGVGLTLLPDEFVYVAQEGKNPTNAIILAHEFGHIVGLQHVSDSSNLMHQSAGAPGTIYENATNLTSNQIRTAKRYSWDQDEPPATVPAAPTGVQASDGTYEDRVQITWYSVSNADSYEVWRNTTNNSGSATKISTTPITATSFNDSTVVQDTTYYYWVKAVNGVGTSGFSSSNSGYAEAAPLPTIPLPPTNINATDGVYDDRIHISWNASNGADYYNVWRHTENDSGAATRIATNVLVTQFDDTNNEAETTYYYWVTATNELGTSDFSSPDTGWKDIVVVDPPDDPDPPVEPPSPTAEVWRMDGYFDITPYKGKTLIQVRYELDSNRGETFYWIYEVGSGANPELEDAIEQASVYLEYLPIGVLMHDTVWFDESDDEEWETTLDRLLKDISIDPYEIKEQYLEQQEEDDASGDAARSNAQTWDFFIHFAVPLKTIFRGGREYLFRFYQFLETKTWTTFDDYQAYLANPVGEQPHTRLAVEEGEIYTGYIARYAWSYIQEVTVEGSFTPPGFSEPLRPRRLWSHTYKLGDSDYNEGLDWVHGAGNYAVAKTQLTGQEHSYTIVTRMNEDGTHTHILMMGPSMEYQINTSQEPVGVGQSGYVDYQYRFIDVELFPDDPEEDSEFRWPVHMGSLREVSAMQREAALNDGLAATVFLVERVKVKWYQKGFFKWLIVIITVIVVILSWQYQLLPSIAAAATAATGATALGLWSLYVVMVFAIGFLVSFAGSLIGGRLGQLFVIVAMVLMAGGNLQSLNPFSQISSAWTNLTTAPSWGSAIQFLQATYPGLAIGQQIYNEMALGKLEDEMRDFIKTAKEKYEDLRDMWDSLQDTPSWIDPLDLARTFATSTVYEDPESFYYRTLHANPGSLGYDLIEDFTEMATMLPKTPGDPGIVDSMMETFAKQRGQV